MHDIYSEQHIFSGLLQARVLVSRSRSSLFCQLHLVVAHHHMVFLVFLVFLQWKVLTVGLLVQM
jgi:hypothetical protein